MENREVSMVQDAAGGKTFGMGMGGLPEGAGPSEPEDDRVFNQAELMERLMDDRELARAVVAAFLSDIPEQIRRMHTFLTDGDAPAAERQAHTIKGAAANIAAPALRGVALEIEKLAGSGDLAAAAQRMLRLENEYERLVGEFREGGWV
jgi:HPt (histidine-containing phosphotransfer) domain-containing protein